MSVNKLSFLSQDITDEEPIMSIAEINF